MSKEIEGLKDWVKVVIAVGLYAIGSGFYFGLRIGVMETQMQRIAVLDAAVARNEAFHQEVFGRLAALEERQKISCEDKR